MIKHSIAIAFLLAFMLIGTIIGARADNVLIPNAALLDLAKDLCGYGIKPNYEHRSSRRMRTLVTLMARLRPIR